MLDINKRVRCEGTTVAEMIEALQRLPQDGIVHFEGKRKVTSIVIQRVEQ